jgi:hypothetical protein
MPKSRQRKDHKKKAQARTRRIQIEQRKYQKEMMEQIEKFKVELSGTTIDNELVQQTT